MEFVTEGEFEDVLTSRDNLNTLLNKVANVAALAGEERGYKRALVELPNIANDITDQKITARDAAKDYLQANPDMVPVRNYLGMKVNELNAKNPEWGLEKLFTEAGDAVREDLKLSKVVKELNEDEGAEDGNPSLPTRGAGGGGGGKGSASTKEKTPLQKEIGELIEHAEKGNS